MTPLSFPHFPTVSEQRPNTKADVGQPGPGEDGGQPEPEKDVGQLEPGEDGGQAEPGEEPTLKPAEDHRRHSNDKIDNGEHLIMSMDMLLISLI